MLIALLVDVLLAAVVQITVIDANDG